MYYLQNFTHWFFLLTSIKNDLLLFFYTNTHSIINLLLCESIIHIGIGTSVKTNTKYFSVDDTKMVCVCVCK